MEHQLQTGCPESLAGSNTRVYPPRDSRLNGHLSGIAVTRRNMYHGSLFQSQNSSRDFRTIYLALKSSFEERNETSQHHVWTVAMGCRYPPRGGLNAFDSIHLSDNNDGV